MGLTSNYRKLAAIAPGKKKRRGRKPKRGGKQPEKRVYREYHPPIDSTPIAPGAVRYFLSIPRSAQQQAISAGCRFDGGAWFIDNPVNLTDFAAWKPRRSHEPIHARIRAHQKLIQQRKQQAGECGQG